jgi:hypothetical protein
MGQRRKQKNQEAQQDGTGDANGNEASMLTQNTGRMLIRGIGCRAGASKLVHKQRAMTQGCKPKENLVYFWILGVGDEGSGSCGAD